MALSDHEMHTILGLNPPEKVAPGNRIEQTLSDVGELDDRLRKHAELNRQFVPDARTGVQRLESTEEAGTRILASNPKLYALHKAEKARILGRNKVGAAAIGAVA
jgi:hypothetical protein